MPGCSRKIIRGHADSNHPALSGADTMLGTPPYTSTLCHVHSPFIYFWTCNALVTAQIPPRCKKLSVALPTSPARPFWDRATANARSFASGNNPRRTKFEDFTKQENFDAPPSQMIPCPRIHLTAYITSLHLPMFPLGPARIAPERR